ncbi:MAG: NFACT family protein, partial [Pyrinomonadaceae bacterium]
MQPHLIRQIVVEMRSRLVGRAAGRIFQLNPYALAFDFGLKGTYLFVSVDPAASRFHLIVRKLRELEKQSTSLSHFGQSLLAKLGSGRLLSIEQDRKDRVVQFSFRVVDELGSLHFRRMIVQLTGRAANLLLLDELDHRHAQPVLTHRLEVVVVELTVD